MSKMTDLDLDLHFNLDPNFVCTLTIDLYLPLLARVAWERLQIDTDFCLSEQALQTTFPVVPTSMTLSDLEPPKIGVFSEFFAIADCDAHLKGEFSPKLLELDRDNLRT